MRGFSLIEVLIVMALLSALLTVVLPAHRQYVLDAGRTEGQSLLMQVASDQERHYSSHHRYSLHADPLVSPPAATRTSRNGLYEASVVACAGGSIVRCFLATASPLGSQAQDPCGALTISDTGRRGASGDRVENCWR